MTKRVKRNICPRCGKQGGMQVRSLTSEYNGGRRQKRYRIVCECAPRGLIGVLSATKRDAWRYWRAKASPSGRDLLLDHRRQIA